MRTTHLIWPLAVAAFIVMACMPSLASAQLVNDYGLTYAGQSTCLDCHPAAFASTQHAAMVQWGAAPSAATSWPIQGSLAGNSGLTIAQSDIAFTFGDRTENQDPDEPHSTFDYATYDPTATTAPQFNRLNVTFDTTTKLFNIPQGPAGITKSSYGTCEKCHQLGVTKPTTTGQVVPNSNVTSQPTSATFDAWAGVSHATPATSAQSFVPGSSIQCENCHGTGVNDPSTNHFSAGTSIVGFGSNDVASHKILDSQICGACHNSSTDVTGTLGTVGWTPDQTLTAFVNITSQTVNPAYTASPGVMFAKQNQGLLDANFYPNGSANGNAGHVNYSYYNEWLQSGHSVRVQVSASSTSASWYQKNVGSHFSINAASTSVGCLECHTGEGYLSRKGAAIMSGFTLTKADSGFYGQECAICHTPHAADGGGVELRTPDPGNTSICEDCHNWQLEVLATGSSTPSSGASIQPTSSTRAVSHPEREMRMGKGLLDVDPALGHTNQAMPGAECQDCHMPQTFEGSAGNFHSHRMLPMLPGNADTWGVPVGGDSCTPCHAGETRAQLQANIDLWTSQASAANTLALSAMAAAAARHGEYTSATVNTLAGADLWGRANVNEQFYTADGSGSVHNPPYILAGLVKAAQLAKSIDGTFAAISAPGSVAADTVFGISGTLVNGDGTRAATATVSLWTGSTQVASTTTDANGNFAFMLAEASSTTYTMKWQRSSNTITWLSKTATVSVIKTTTRLSIARSASAITLGRSVSLSGELERSPFTADHDLTGASVRIQARRPGTTTWTTLTTKTTNSDGRYAYAYKPNRRGTWLFRATYGGSSVYASATSPSISVVVR